MHKRYPAKPNQFNSKNCEMNGVYLNGQFQDGVEVDCLTALRAG